MTLPAETPRPPAPSPEDVLEAVDAILYDWDVASGSVGRSGALRAILGYPPSEVEPTIAWWRERMHPEDRAALGAVVADPDGGSSARAEYRVRHRDGSYRTLRDTQRLLRDDGGAVVRVVGTTVDVTELRRASDALLRHDERRLRLARLAQALSGAADLDAVAAAIVEHGLGLTGAVAGVVTVLSDAGDELHVLADVGFLPGELDAWRVVPLAAPTLAGEAARTGELVVVPTAAARRARFPNHGAVRALAEGGAGVGVPLVAGGRTVGALSLTLPDPGGPDEDARAALRATADLCAHALARALLLERERAARAEAERLRDEAERLRAEFTATFEQAPIGVAHTDRDHRWLRFNRKMCEITGYAPEELAHLDWTAITHPDDLPRQLELEARMLAGEIPSFGIEKQYVRRDGSAVWVELQTATVHQDGAVAYSVAMVQDITERRRAEANRQFRFDLDDRLRALDRADAICAEAAAALAAHLAVDACYVVEVDPDRRLATILAGDARAGPPLAGAFLLDAFLAPAAFDRLRAGEPVAVVDVAADPAVPPGGAAAARAIGTEAWVLVPWVRAGAWRAGVTVHSAVPRAWRPDEVGVLRDVAARVWPLVERARVAADHARQASLLDQAFDAILAWEILGEAEGPIVYWNQGAERLYGYAAAEAVGRTSHDLLAAVHPGGRDAFLAELLRSGELEADLVHTAKAGRPVEVRSRQQVVADGDRRLVLEANRDVSDLRALDRAQQDFTASASHDLKNPIGAIRAEAQLLLRRLARGDPPDADRTARTLDSIVRTTHTMAALVDDLVDVSVLRAGRPVELAPAPVDLRAVVERACALTVPRYGGEVRSRVPDAPLVARVDERRVERVLANLLANAVKYSPALGLIEVELSAVQRDGAPAAEVVVRDAGVGIPAADLPVVFERFRRGGNVAGVAGTGIGLAGARQIVELHGGTISAASTEGAGSTFTVTLPL